MMPRPLPFANLTTTPYYDSVDNLSVVQLAERLPWAQEVGSSSLPTQTKSTPKE